jgi:hypothetical protein
LTAKDAAALFKLRQAEAPDRFGITECEVQTSVIDEDRTVGKRLVEFGQRRKAGILQTVLVEMAGDHPIGEAVSGRGSQ